MSNDDNSSKFIEVEQSPEMKKLQEWLQTDKGKESMLALTYKMLDENYQNLIQKMPDIFKK